MLMNVNRREKNRHWMTLLHSQTSRKYQITLMTSESSLNRFEVVERCRSKNIGLTLTIGYTMIPLYAEWYAIIVPQHSDCLLTSTS